MADLRPCRVCNFSRQKSVGLVVPSLDQLKQKGIETLGFSPSALVSVVLEDDGTIVADEAYFLCLPSNTKFMLLCDEQSWVPPNKVDGGTAWLTRESIYVQNDEVDFGRDAWKGFASQLKQDLASIILMSEAELQSLVDAPCVDLASALGFSEEKARSLQDTLQNVLDRREEQRQSKELLQLYLKTVEQEDCQETQEPQQERTNEEATDQTDGMEVDSVSGFRSRTLMVLKGKTSPETRLSNEELQRVVEQGATAMAQVLGWQSEKACALVQACEGELQGRLQQVQTLHALSAASKPTKPTPVPDKGPTATKRSK